MNTDREVPEWENVFEKSPILGGAFRDIEIMLKDRKGIEKAINEHKDAIKDFIRFLLAHQHEQDMARVLEVLPEKAKAGKFGEILWTGGYNDALSEVRQAITQLLSGKT